MSYGYKHYDMKCGACGTDVMMLLERKSKAKQSVICVNCNFKSKSAKRGLWRAIFFTIGLSEDMKR